MSFSQTFSDQEFSSVAVRKLAERRSMIDRPYRLAENLLSKHTTETGGVRYSIPFRVQRHSSTTQMDASGFNAVLLDGQEIFKPGSQTWGYWIHPVMVSGREELEYRGSGKILDIFGTRAQDARNHVLAQVEQQVAAGTAPNYSDLITLNGLDDTGGIVEENAVGSQTNVVHSFSKSTYSALAGTQNQIADGGGDFSANFHLLKTMVRRAKDLTPTEGAAVDLHWYWDIQLMENWERIIQPQERYTAGGADAQAQEVMVFGNVPIAITDQLPQAGATTTADPVGAYLIDHAAIKMVMQAGTVMNMDAAREVSGHNAMVAFLYNAGQLTVDYWASSGVGFDFQTF
jgi:hypothetical protein